MVAYSFQPQFAEPIIAGTKRQTIRRPGKRRHARPGERLQLYTGMRTKQCRKIGDAVCEGVFEIALDLRMIRGFSITSRSAGVNFGNPLEALTTHPITPPRFKSFDAFARADGFADWAALKAFFEQHHPGVDQFEGFLITWTDFQPASFSAPKISTAAAAATAKRRAG